MFTHEKFISFYIYFHILVSKGFVDAANQEGGQVKALEMSLKQCSL